MATHQLPKKYRRPDLHGSDELSWIVNAQEDLHKLQAALKTHEVTEGRNRYFLDADKKMATLIRAVEDARAAMRDWAVYGG